MILIHNTLHQSLYEQAAWRWDKLKVLVIVLMLCIHTLMVAGYLYHYHRMNALLKPLQDQMQKNQGRLKVLKQWEAEIKIHEAHREQREANRQKVDDMYQRLADFHAVNLRLLRIKPNYIYCGIENVAEVAVQQYQHYLKKMHYKLVSQQRIEKMWFLEFARHDGA